MKIYTKTGDQGETGLFGGTRLSKASLLVEAYGDVDELNSVLGLARLHPVDDTRDALLSAIQSELFHVGAELATRPGKESGIPLVGEAQILALESAIDAAEAELPPLANFVLPGGSPAAAHLHLARTVCRRAERKVVALAQRETGDEPTAAIRGELLRYLNRLSDLLFVLARLANRRAGVEDVPWRGRSSSGAS